MKSIKSPLILPKRTIGHLSLERFYLSLDCFPLYCNAKFYVPRSSGNKCLLYFLGLCTTNLPPRIVSQDELCSAPESQHSRCSSKHGVGHLGTTEPTQTQPCAEEDSGARFCLLSAALLSSSCDTGKQERAVQSRRCAEELAAPAAPRSPRTTTMQGTYGTQLQMGPRQISLPVKCFGSPDILGTQNV